MPRQPRVDVAPRCNLSVAGLFAGIGGFELGLRAAGHLPVVLCEVDPAAHAVLRTRFPEAELWGDVQDIDSLPQVDVLVAGFPCQDLSQAGRTDGIAGRHSGLVSHVFRLLERSPRKPTWVVLENVPFMLQLDGGTAMRFVTWELERLGYWWAYRVVDSMAFGLPQRRRRVFLVAALEGAGADPRAVLLAEDAGPPESVTDRPLAYGFYWTEGNRGLGLAPDAVPPLKGGSRVPSPPAIWRVLSEDVVTPDVRDAERLQGFPDDWTLPAVTDGGCRANVRWRLVGNAVSVPVAEWIGQRLSAATPYAPRADQPLARVSPWPSAAWGRRGEVYMSRASPWPVRRSVPRITQFLLHPPIPLSERATAGFLDRLSRSRLRVPDGFIEALEGHVRRMKELRSPFVVRGSS